MPAANVDRTDLKVFGDLVELRFQGEARLWCAVPALRPAWRLVGEDAHAFKFIARHVVGHGLQRASVKGRSDTVAAIGTAIEEGAKVHGGDRAVAFHAGLHPHQDRMATAMAIEDFFAG